MSVQPKLIDSESGEKGCVLKALPAVVSLLEDLHVKAREAK